MGAVLCAAALSACGVAERKTGESDREYVLRLHSDCSAEHADDVSQDEEIAGCWADAVEAAVGDGALPGEALEDVNRGFRAIQRSGS